MILFARDVPELAAFYRDVLGLKILSDPSDLGWIELDAGSIKLGIHRGTPSGSMRGAPKLVFGTDDVVAVREELVERGAKLGAVKGTSQDTQLCDGRDPEGNAFQISNRP
jgi:predicted enzyme related to lactoylglutathione lyase